MKVVLNVLNSLQEFSQNFLKSVDIFLWPRIYFCIYGNKIKNMEIYFSSGPIGQPVPLTTVPGPPANEPPLPAVPGPPANRSPPYQLRPTHQRSFLSSVANTYGHSSVRSVFSCRHIPAPPIRAILPSPHWHCLPFHARLDCHRRAFLRPATPRGNAQCTPHASGH
jgi:hypothetical protein